MLTRRACLQRTIAFCLAGMPLTALANTNRQDDNRSWQVFVENMQALASDFRTQRISQAQLVSKGQDYLNKLDPDHADFKQAVTESFESGNRFWLWQRLLKQNDLNAGVLNISSDQIVQLHDHPGATGMLRIIEGEAEVWQFDASTVDGGVAELGLYKHQHLRPGDIAVLEPGTGNIHALRSITSGCRMLDCFIPPYNRQKRTWYLPLNDDWQSKDIIACRPVAESDYYV